MRHLSDEALWRTAARTTTAHTRLRQETAERAFAELKWRIFDHTRFLMRRRRGDATEIAIGIFSYNRKQSLRALRRTGSIAVLAT